MIRLIALCQERSDKIWYENITGAGRGKESHPRYNLLPRLSQLSLPRVWQVRRTGRASIGCCAPTFWARLNGAASRCISGRLG